MAGFLVFIAIDKRDEERDYDKKIEPDPINIQEIVYVYYYHFLFLILYSYLYTIVSKSQY